MTEQGTKWTEPGQEKFVAADLNMNRWNPITVAWNDGTRSHHETFSTAREARSFARDKARKLGVKADLKRIAEAK